MLGISWENIPMLFTMLVMLWENIPMLFTVLGMLWENIPMLFTMLGISWGIFPCYSQCWDREESNTFPHKKPIYYILGISSFHKYPKYGNSRPSSFPILGNFPI